MKTMNAHEYKAQELEDLLYQTGLKASELSRMAGIRPDKFSRWRKAHQKIPGDTRLLMKALALLSEEGVDVRGALERASVGLGGS